MTMTPDPFPQTPPNLEYQSQGLVNADSEHLKILSICWYVASGLLAICGFFPLIYVVIGIFMMSTAKMAAAMGPGGPPPAVFGGMMAIFGALGALFMWTTAILSFLTGRALARRRRIVLCYITAAISCIQFPIGTTLGVFTFIVLARPSVKSQFQ